MICPLSSNGVTIDQCLAVEDYEKMNWERSAHYRTSRNGIRPHPPMDALHDDMVRNLIVGPVEVVGSIEESPILFLEILPGPFGVDVDTETGSLEKIDHRILHDRLAQADHDVLPPRV
jgi:hypothetical protein